MRALVPLSILAAAALGVLWIMPDPHAPAAVQETFGELTKRRCAIEATEARRKECYDRAILQKAVEMERDKYERAKAAIR